MITLFGVVVSLIILNSCMLELIIYQFQASKTFKQLFRFDKSLIIEKLNAHNTDK